MLSWASWFSWWAAQSCDLWDYLFSAFLSSTEIEFLLSVLFKPMTITSVVGGICTPMLLAQVTMLLKGFLWELWPWNWYQGVSSLSCSCEMPSWKIPICPSCRCRHIWLLPTKSEASACPSASCPSCSCCTGIATGEGTYAVHKPLAQPLWMGRGLGHLCLQTRSR